MVTFPLITLIIGLWLILSLVAVVPCLRSAQLSQEEERLWRKRRN